MCHIQEMRFPFVLLACSLFTTHECISGVSHPTRIRIILLTIEPHACKWVDPSSSTFYCDATEGTLYASTNVKWCFYVECATLLTFFYVDFMAYLCLFYGIFILMWWHIYVEFHGIHGYIWFHITLKINPVTDMGSLTSSSLFHFMIYHICCFHDMLDLNPHQGFGYVHD